MLKESNQSVTIFNENVSTLQLLLSTFYGTVIITFYIICLCIEIYGMVSQSLKHQIAAERFAILKTQESIYVCVDYLDPEFQHQKLLQNHHGSNAMFDSLKSDSSSGSLNEVWREKICEWSYQVVDHFDFSREVVGVSMSFLDRYLSTRRVNKKIFQLAAMTCLYLSIKLYEPGSLKVSSLIGLSRGFFTKEHIISMEESILTVLDYRLHPPTVMGFIRDFISLLSDNVDERLHIDIYELATFLSELSVCDYFFVGKMPSNVALACVLTAFEGMSHDRLPRACRQEFVDDIFRLAKINCTVNEVHQCRLRLRDVYQRGGYNRKAAIDREANQSPNNINQSNRTDSSRNESQVHSVHCGGSTVRHLAIKSTFVDTSCEF